MRLVFPRRVVSECRTRAGARATLHSSFLRCDSQSFHLAIEVASLEAQHFRGAAHVTVILVEFLEDVIPLIGITSLVEAGEFGPCSPSASIAINKRRQVLTLEARGSGVHDDD